MGKAPTNLGEMRKADLQRQSIEMGSPFFKCTMLPKHLRQNRQLPHPFEVMALTPVPDGTEVVVRAGNINQPFAELRNYTACFMNNFATFNDFRLLSRSGRGKTFTLSITIKTKPPQIASYQNAIKITADGQRESRKSIKRKISPDSFPQSTSSKCIRLQSTGHFEPITIPSMVPPVSNFSMPSHLLNMMNQRYQSSSLALLDHDLLATMNGTRPELPVHHMNGLTTPSASGVNMNLAALQFLPPGFALPPQFAMHADTRLRCAPSLNPMYIQMLAAFHLLRNNTFPQAFVNNIASMTLSEPRVSTLISAFDSATGKLHHHLPPPDNEMPSLPTADVSGDIAGGNVGCCSDDSSTLTPAVADSSSTPVNLSFRNKDGKSVKSVKPTKFGVEDLLSSNHVASRQS